MSNRSDFDKYAENYSQLLNEKTRFFSSGDEYFARYKIDLVRKHITSNIRRILEYGCGIGRNIPYLQRAFPGAIIIGSDISPASLEVARRDNELVEFLLEDGKKLGMEGFDLIFVAGVFHHIPMPQRIEVAKTLFGRLNPKGSLFVFEHNPYNPVTRRIVDDCPYDEDATLVKMSELKNILRSAAMTVEQQAYCLFVPPRFTSFKWIESKLGWLPLGGQYWVLARRLI